MSDREKRKLDKFYQKADPWEYETNPHDKKRKEIILKELKKYTNIHNFFKALDIGAGEGWLTKDLPAHKIYGYEISDVASSRFPKNVERIKDEDLVGKKFDLIIATGVFYKQFDFKKMLDMVMKHASGIVLTCNISDWEINDLPFKVKEFDFKYRQYVEHLAIYDFNTSQRWKHKKS